MDTDRNKGVEYECWVGMNIDVSTDAQMGVKKGSGL